MNLGKDRHLLTPALPLLPVVYNPCREKGKQGERAGAAPQDRHMTIGTQDKAEIIARFAQAPGDTGSAEVQVALLTGRINELNKHLQVHKKDVHSRRGLLLMVGQRRKFLKYLADRNYPKYQEVIQALGLRK